jgi:hypothetical protein
MTLIDFFDAAELGPDESLIAYSGSAHHCSVAEGELDQIERNWLVHRYQRLGRALAGILDDDDNGWAESWALIVPSLRTPGPNEQYH